MRETKQVIVMRKDLNMRKGKMVAQGAHASLGIFTRFLQLKEDKPSPLYALFATPEPVREWLSSGFKKVCVSVSSEKELLDIYNKVPNDIPKILITDSGATEFNGVPTKTCIAIGPWWSDELDKYTGELPLL